MQPFERVAQTSIIIVLVWRNTNLVLPKLFELVLQGGQSLTKQIPGQWDDMLMAGVTEVANKFVQKPVPDAETKPDAITVG